MLPDNGSQCGADGKYPAHSREFHRNRRNAMAPALFQQQMPRIGGNPDPVSPLLEVPCEDEYVILAAGENVGGISEKDIQ